MICVQAWEIVLKYNHVYKIHLLAFYSGNTNTRQLQIYIIKDFCDFHELATQESQFFCCKNVLTASYS